jgi:acyl carrier protein
MSETVHEQIRRELAALLGCEPAEIHEDTDFQELGLDSVFGVMFMQNINTRFQLHEPLDLTTRYRSIDALASYLATAAPATTSECA